MLWLDAPSGLVAAVYLVAGWQMMLDFPAYAAALNAAETALLAVGGGLYTVGAIVYALKRPNPWPRCSATTRSSTRSSCSPRCATGWPSSC